MALKEQAMRHIISLEPPSWIMCTSTMITVWKTSVVETLSFSTVQGSGFRVPLVFKPTAEVATRVKESVVTDAFCTVMDILPTILEYAGRQHPASYTGRPVMPLRGKSWKSFLDRLENVSRYSPIHDEDYVVEFEIKGSGAVRRGEWKITFVPAPKDPQRWELFNIKSDPGETNDLSEAQPELMVEILQLWENYKTEAGL
ncbi:unnamed protein product [Fusarium venenatum]|uniref:N-sulphoglucosamine sulphohydrolase C-terminal domain-containing protein n=1 Tax=Fusarium venenatum TaxID=56646 RepID=A0A2L2TAA1_9HYPO|nr:uncharacterized protein FVRRES_11123 [Fusarium venenatum]CEI38432.1 unnamed protein product [Fusarium venenatum]